MNVDKSETQERAYTNLDNSGPILVYVRDGKVVRVRPLPLSQQDVEDSSWVIQVGDKSFTPLPRNTVAPFTLCTRDRLYSSSRLRWPLKRVDFNPDGDNHPENRGKSEHARISWDEAISLVAGEIQKIKEKYGPGAILGLHSSHHTWGLLHYRFAAWQRFMNILGCTWGLHNPDSWEGWVWGATHVWGFYWRNSVAEQWDLLEDALKNSDTVVYWANDPDSTRRGYGGQESVIWRLWLKELGKRQIFIDPFCNYTAGILADKWISPRPGTDAALAAAIAYIWFEEGTYDKDYVETHTVGFKGWEDYIMGKEDGVLKTPHWAEETCGVKAYVIKALAREWASKKTMLSIYYGGACRGAYGHEWARMMVCLQGMQGLGKPGVNIWFSHEGAPQDVDFKMFGYSDRPMDAVAKKPSQNTVNQFLYRLLIPDGILNPPVSWLSPGFCNKSIEEQFQQFTYPAPGYPEIHMIYRYGGSYIGTMTDTNKWIAAYRSPKIEFALCQTPWMEPEARLADVILPACTNLERNDISEWGGIGGYSKDGTTACNRRVIVYQKKCVEPLYESKSDYDIFVLLAGRLGFIDEYAEGNSEEDWLKKIFEASDLHKHMNYDRFKERGYFVVPFPRNYRPRTAMREFYEKGTGLGTYTGKLEYTSNSLLRFRPDDKERPPVPRYISSWEGHGSELSKKYPLQLITPHPRFSYHTQFDEKSRWIMEIPQHRVFKNGYCWWPLRINPKDAEVRRISDRDIVKVYNDRGAVLCIAQVTERVREGVLHAYESCGIYDPLECKSGAPIDKGGCVNLLTPSRFMSKNAPGMAPYSCLVEVEKWREKR